MRGLIFFSLAMILVLTGCDYHSCAVKKQAETQSASEECPTGECCSIKSRAEMLQKSSQAKGNQKTTSTNAR